MLRPPGASAFLATLALQEQARPVLGVLCAGWLCLAYLSFGGTTGATEARDYSQPLGAAGNLRRDSADADEGPAPKQGPVVVAAAGRQRGKSGLPLRKRPLNR